uniref:Putative secreted protein n=1 Tax=Anopheles darlingi TaxID=43151 RepID=A0A2M4DRJ1_ANODA
MVPIVSILTPVSPVLSHTHTYTAQVKETPVFNIIPLPKHWFRIFRASGFWYRHLVNVFATFHTAVHSAQLQRKQFTD